MTADEGASTRIAVTERARSITSWMQDSLAFRVALICGLLLLVHWPSHDLWFHHDDWDYLTRRSGGSLDSYLEPHASHWTVPQVAEFRFLHALFGLDYFPWYHLPRLIGAGLLALYFRRILIRRGTHPLIALAAMSVLLVLDASAGHRIVSIGNYIGLAAMMFAADRIARDAPPTPREEVGVGLALVAAVCSFSTGPIVALAALVVVGATGRLRTWWRPVIAPVAVYALWSLTYGPDRAGGLLGVDLPGQMFAILADSQASFFGAPLWVGAIAALVEVAAIAWWAVCGRLDRFDAIVVLTVLGFLAATSSQRLAGDVSLATNRYGYVPIVGLALVIVPRLPSPSTVLQRAVVVVVGVALVAVNLVGLSDHARTLANSSAIRRVRVEAAAQMLVAGEPAVETSWITLPLTVRGLSRLVDDGYAPTSSASDAELMAARGYLRIRQPKKSNDVLDADDPGCVEAMRGDRLEFALSGAGRVRASGGQGSRIVVRWIEGDLVGERTMGWSQGRASFRGESAVIELAPPSGEMARVEIDVDRARDLVICLPPQ